jgi:hypothetical protein
VISKFESYQAARWGPHIALTQEIAKQHWRLERDYHAVKAVDSDLEIDISPISNFLKSINL